MRLGFFIGAYLFMWITGAWAETRGLGIVEAGSGQPVWLQGKYRALVIGNGAYKDPEKHWRPLKTAQADARAFADLLRTQYAFEDVVVLVDAGQREILRALYELSHRVQKEDSVVLFYAGHGYLDADTRKGYWVPVDAQGMDQTTFIRDSTIRDEMSTIADRAKHTLLVADSCFSGTLLRNVSRGVANEETGEKYYKKVAGKKSVQILAAGGVEFVDDNYRDSGHSPFTYFLLNELGKNDKPILALSELSTKVEMAVANNVDQVPESGVLHGAGDELGEFIFINIRVKIDAQGVAKDKVNVDVSVQPETRKNGGAPEGEARPPRVLPLPTL